MDDPELDAALEALHGLPLGEFVKERNRLAREMKAKGNVAGSRRVAEAEKPSVSAWTINQLWRAHRDVVDELFASAHAVRRATRHGGDELRAATAEQRDVLAQLRHLAEGVLRGAGHAPNEAVLRRIATTLSALAAAGSFAPDRPGQLTADRDPPGFGELAGIPEPPESSTRMKTVEPSEAKRAAAEAAERARRVAEAKRLVATAKKAREKAEKELETRARTVERARDALADAEQARAEAEETLKRARDEESAAEDELSAAETK